MPAFKASLQTILQNVAALNGVQVSYGVPLPNPSSEYIWLGDVTNNQEPGAVGGPVREEDYTLTVMVSVVRSGPDQKSTTERAYAIFDQIATAVEADPTVGGVLTSYTDPSFAASGDLQELTKPDGSGRGANLTVNLNVINRI